MKYYIIWFLIFFTSFEGFGLRSPSWGGLGSSSLGWYGILQLSVLVLSLVFPFLLKSKFYFNNNQKMGVPAALIYMLLLFIVIQSLVMALFSGSLSLSDLFSNLVKFKFILLYFIFIYLLSRPEGLKIAIRSILICSLISAIILFFIIMTGFQSYVVQVMTSESVGREFRVILPSAMLITFGFYYIFSKAKYIRNWSSLIIGLIFFMAMLSQMHRSVLVSIVLVTFFSFYKLYQIKIKSIFPLLILLGIFYFGINLAFDQIGYSFENLFKTFVETKKEVGDTTGNFAVRLFLPVKSFLYVLNNYYLIGVGLNWEPITDIISYITLDKYFATPTYDSGYNNIIVIYGILGIAIYLFLFYRLFKTIGFIIKNSKQINYIITAYAAMFTLIFLMLTGTSSDSYILQPAAVIFTFIIALVYNLETKILREINEENNFTA